MVKKPKHIWFFILATGITNFLSGVLVYYGLVAIVGKYVKAFMKNYRHIVHGLELALGIAVLIATLRLIIKTIKIKSNHNQGDEERFAKKIKSVSPFSLTIIGVTATLYELTSALPYFAFLAVLLTFSLSPVGLLLILLLYNAIYISPQVTMYFLYIKKQDKFDKLYSFIKDKITRYSAILTPSALTIVGGFLITHSIFKLI